MMQYIKVINKLRTDCPECEGAGYNNCSTCEGDGYILIRREEEIPLEEAIRRTNAYNNKRF